MQHFKYYKLWKTKAQKMTGIEAAHGEGSMTQRHGGTRGGQTPRGQ